ncbi:MAG: hypothetical protein Unbinned4388contig1000_68 [Prokaryotic dsDNA virus sp.]|nr:MAG: hypothetical protein Unbinned4388contig1000_68 [Prokaryotic dsDNA virus sp.]|tara:strand:- start:1635 stop:1835 length:201 start_codon:yes stop_codon:yes gene_type:complete
MKQFVIFKNGYKPTAKYIKTLGRTYVYKGFGINYFNGFYRAAAYANPTFEGNNLKKILKQINTYLK